MAEPPRYWTRDFIDRFVEALNEDADFQREASSFSDTIVLQCLETPAGRDVSAAYSIDAGYVTVAVVDLPSPSADVRSSRFDSGRAMARATAPYRIWKELDSGAMTVLGALASPDYRIEGPRLKIMMNLGIMNAMSRVAATVEKVY